MMDFLVRLLGAFHGDRRANVSLITAFCAIPMFGMLGFALDYGTAFANKVKLDNAADEAAMVAITTVKTVMVGGGTFASGQAQGVTQAQMAFNASAGRLGFASVPSISPNISQSNQTISASVSYSTPVTTNFSKIIGISNIPVSGTSSASLALTTYMRIYIVVDVSQSMGIGTDATNMQALYNRVVQYNNGSGGETGCVFGCHVMAAGQTYTNEYLAHSISPTITLRIDSAISAIQTIISQAQTKAGSTANISIGLYEMSLNPTSSTSYIYTVASPSTSYSSLSTAATTIDLGYNTSNGLGDSTFTTSLADFYTSVLGANGTGVSASSPLNYVFLITDGVQDTYSTSCGSTFSHCMGTISPSVCTNIKNAATLGVIYTTYNPIYSGNNSANGLESNYQLLVSPIASTILPSLQACATPSTASTTYFYQASDGATLITDMQELFASTTQTARITQ